MLKDELSCGEKCFRKC